MKRTIAIALALGLVLPLSLVTPVAAVEIVPEVWVDDDASGEWYDKTHFATIQEGIDAVDPGGTVNVAEGTYAATTENSIALDEDLGYCFVHIDKSISLIGESRDGVILDGSLLHDEYRSTGIWVSASDVTVKNLTIQNFYVSDPDHYSYGLVSWEKFRNFNTAEPYVLLLSYVTAENLKVVDCQASLYFMMTEHATVKDCVVENSLADGIWVAMGSANATVQGNTVTDSADHGIWVGGASWCPPVNCPSATITDNTISGAREGGISFVNSDGATISGNTITNAAGEGWSVGALSLKDGCSNVEAYDNTIYNNDGSWSGYSGTGHGVGIDGTPLNINLYHNNIYDNSGDGCHNYSIVAVNATNNWWGTTDGELIATLVSDNADYDPWLTESYPPAPKPSGGGGASRPPPGTTKVSRDVDNEGVFEDTVKAKSDDKQCYLTIPEGTVGLTDEQEPLRKITMEVMDEPPPPPEDANVIGLPYDFGPDGATFNPPVTLTWSYDPDAVPEGMDLVVAYWDGSEWVELENCVVDTQTNTIYALVSHFTAFAVIARAPEVVVEPIVEEPEMPVVPPEVTVPEEVVPPEEVAPPVEVEVPPEPVVPEPAGRDLRWIIGVAVFLAIFFPVRWWRKHRR